MTGDEIQAIRKKLHISQEDLAEVLMLSVCTINRWEAARTEVKAKGLHAMILEGLQRWLDFPQPKGKTHRGTFREWTFLAPSELIRSILAEQYGP